MAITNTDRDIILWDHFRNGDAESFVSLFKNYYSDLFNYGCKITDDHAIIEDCIQELFIDLWRTQGKAEILSLKAYFFRAFKFKLIKAIGKAGKTISLLPEIHQNEFEISHEMLLINDQENAALAQKVFNAMQELSARQKEIIYLKFHQNLSYEEVGEIMNINYQAARNLVYQAIKVLKKIITIQLIFVSFFC
ncbi:MAG: polymerase, sigma-24 subunit, subfamily [Chitinophagaceae bacterium]|nr:polymerase, sigma-24 subunit, subfamily [Chitinophagaceae bacterium]MDB5224327.1 polymerase, sigma-24 subunit, subfamily [Chitinophagaceae bacterium]